MLIYFIPFLIFLLIFAYLKLYKKYIGEDLRKLRFKISNGIIPLFKIVLVNIQINIV